jgi:hypothetical protein
MKAEMWERFASKLDTPNNAPEPHRTAFLNAVVPGETIRSLIFGPANKTLGKISPATLFAITDKGWIWVSGTDEGVDAPVRCSFKDTLIAELVVVLLSGDLKIDFWMEGGVSSVTMAFNTVMLGYYQELVRLLLNGIGKIDETPLAVQEPAKPLPNTLPFKFKSAVMEFKPPTHHVMDVVHWLSVSGGRIRWFQHKLSPEATLVLTEWELICISDADTGETGQDENTAKYGTIVTYCPLSRLDSCAIESSGELEKLTLLIRTAKGGRTFAIGFPHAQKNNVQAFLKQVRERRSTLPPAKQRMD